jgi:hypothetical protein
MELSAKKIKDIRANYGCSLAEAKKIATYQSIRKMTKKAQTVDELKLVIFEILNEISKT